MTAYFCSGSIASILLLLAVICSLPFLPVSASWVSANSQNHGADEHAEVYGHSRSWYEDVEAKWGGHLKGRAAVSWPDEDSFFHPVGTGTYYDGNTELRLKNALFFGEWAYFETHYEALFAGGDTRSKGRELERMLPDLFQNGFLVTPRLEDDRRLLDLTKTIDETNDYILHHRLDRLALTLLPQRGVVRIGRQAITWGNGLLFNPMDLFNPFSPTDIERDYKIGDDMVFAQFSLARMGDWQLLAVPRRDASSGDLESDQSSLGGKLHFTSGITEFDIMVAHHYDDAVVGLGSRGYVGDAAWRIDATLTFLDEDSDANDYLSFVVNMDYSWVWWQKNFYGFVEFYYNGLGDDDYTKALADPDISERLDRGELFTLGRTYLGAHMRLELHPLLNVYLTLINNLNDPSGILQPRATWDITQNVQMTFGGDMPYGAKGTEYGGYEMPGTDLLIKAADRAFLWLTYFF